jgi:MFS family permease
MIHPPAHYPLVVLVVGVLLLLFGRKLFWLFLGFAGFAAGVAATEYLLPHQSELFTLVVALALGLVGALLAIFLQKVAIAIAGFAGGGYLAYLLCERFYGLATMGQLGPWLAFLVGGIIGAILMSLFFNWALIILSSLHGSHMILRALTLPPHYFMLLYVVLALVGIVIQASAFRKPSRVAVE